jgi:2-polyprenyl-6-methoxyphenol hydroxylase-like FAD-dependent oxidoreductase
MRLSRRPDDPEQPAGFFDRGRILVMIDRRDYWQCAFVIPKGGYEKVKQKGLEALRADIAAIAPFVRDRVGELRAWDDIKLLTVVVDRLRKWHRPGLLCIGDAAHAMSPVGGVGINLAIQDAVAAANTLAVPLRAGRVTTNDLWKVQRRRVWPTWVTQRLQVLVQDRVLRRVLRSQQRLSLPWALRLFRYMPILTRIPARLIGLGIRPEHVRSLDVGRTPQTPMARAAPALTN